jgi:hypothetical protein
VHRRAFLTALSAIPAVALFPKLLLAEPVHPPTWVKLILMYKAMESFGDSPDALYMSVAWMKKVAKMFEVRPDYDEFEIPWGGDICGIPGDSDQVKVVAFFGPGNLPRLQSTLYLFNWKTDTFVRHEPGHLAVSFRLTEVIRL